jgi:hypothetical protein
MLLFRSWHFSIASAALVLAGGCLQALADDVSLDNLTFTTKAGGTATIKHVEFDGTNLTRDEVAKLFSPTGTREELTPIVAKLKAAKILIPDLVVATKDATGTLTFHDFQATGVSEGKIEHMSLAGFDGTGTVPDAGPVTVHSGPIAIDGGDFSRLLPALRDGNFASAGGAQITHFTWQGFNMTFPDKETPATADGGNLFKLAIDSVEGRGTYDGDLPAKGSAEMSTFTLEPPKASKFGRSLAEFGYDRLDIGFTMSGSYDANAKTYVLDDYTIRGVDAGSLGFKAQFGGIDRSAFSGDQTSRLAALANGNVSSAAVTFVNNGLFEKAVAYVAKMQQKTPDAIKQQWSAMATQLLPAFLVGNPGALKLAAAVTKFIAAPKALTVTAAAKGGPVAFGDFATGEPALLLQRIDLDATAQ